MYLQIVTPEACLVQGDVESLTVPGMDGGFQMLNNHAAIVSSLGKGVVAFSGSPEFMPAHKDKFTEKDGKWLLQISSGTIQMVYNKVIVLAD